MFMKRAFETSRSTFVKRHRSLLCIAAAAAFVMCMSPKASAQTTYNPSAVTCASGGNYQPPTSDPVNPTPTNDAELDANQTGPYGTWTVLCTWSGYASHVTTTAMSLHVGVSFGCAPKGAQGAATITAFIGASSLGGWHTACRDGGAFGTLTFPVPIGTDLSQISVVARDAITAGSGGDDNSGLSITTLSIY